MASYSGQDAIINVGSDAVGELKNASINITGDEVDTTVFGATGKSKTRKIVLREASCEMSGFLDPDDPGQAALMTALMAAANVGEIAAMTIYPFGVAAGTNYTGAWVILSSNVSIAQDGMVEASFSLKSNGEIDFTA